MIHNQSANKDNVCQLYHHGDVVWKLDNNLTVGVKIVKLLNFSSMQHKFTGHHLYVKHIVYQGEADTRAVPYLVVVVSDVQ